MKNIFNPEARAEVKHPSKPIRNRITRSLMVTGLIISGCAQDEASSYNPDSRAVCALISAKVQEPNYEADRWTTESDIPRLSEEIAHATAQIDNLATYALCVDDGNQAHAVAPEMILTIRRYGLDREEGYHINTASIPGIISSDEMERRYQTEIASTHGF